MSRLASISFLVLVSVLAASSCYSQSDVTHIPLKGRYDALFSGKIGDSVLLFVSYEKQHQKRPSFEGVLQSGVFVKPGGEKVFFDAPAEIADRIIGVSARGGKIFFYVAAARDGQPFLKTYRRDDSGTFQDVGSIPIKGEVRSVHMENDLFLTIQNSQNTIELVRISEGKIQESETVELPEELRSPRRFATIWTKEVLTPLEAGYRMKFYITDNEFIITYDHVSNTSKNYTLVYRVDRHTGERISYRVPENSGLSFRSTWHDNHLYRILKHKRGLNVEVFRRDSLMHQFAMVVNGGDLANKTAYSTTLGSPLRTIPMKNLVQPLGPPFITIHPIDSINYCLRLGVQTVDDTNLGGPDFGLGYLMAVASAVISAAQPERYENPQYCYFKGSFHSGFKYAETSEALQHKIDVLERERKWITPFRYVNRFPGENAQWGVYVEGPVPGLPKEVLVIRYE